MLERMRSAALFAMVMTMTGAGGLGAQPHIGGVQGATSTPETGALGTFSFQVVETLQPAVPAIVTPQPPVVTPRLWMEGYPDWRLPIGVKGVLHATADQRGYLLLWSLDANGAVFPIADGLARGREVVEVGPDRVATLPSDRGFELTVCPPEGQGMFLVLHSDEPMPEAIRRDMGRRIAGARVGDAGGTARLAEQLGQMLREAAGDWKARTSAYPYMVTAGTTDPRCAVADARPPAAAPAPTAVAPPPSPPAPVPTPVPTPVPAPATPAALPAAPPAGSTPSPATAAAPALAWLQSSQDEIAVTLSNHLYWTNQPMEITVRAPVACNSLTVLALGAGGAIDVLLPNAEQSEGTVRAQENLAVPPPASRLRLFVRKPPSPSAEERVVAVCDQRAGRPLVSRDAGDGETLTLRPGTPRHVALERQLRDAQAGGSLLVGIKRYTNGGDRQ